MTAPRILVVEDEALVALDLECTLEDMGWQVAGLMGGVRQALNWLDAQPSAPQAALLDVNLGGEMVFPVAEALEARRIPFAFATGYADVVARSGFADTPTLSKPVDHDRLREVLEALLDRR